MGTASCHMTDMSNEINISHCKRWFHLYQMIIFYNRKHMFNKNSIFENTDLGVQWMANMMDCWCPVSVSWLSNSKPPSSPFIVVREPSTKRLQKKKRSRGKKIPFRICVRSNNVLYSPKIGVFFQKINQMPHTFTAWFSLIKKMGDIYYSAHFPIVLLWSTFLLNKNRIQYDFVCF
jgi:hypothetical protein